MAPGRRGKIESLFGIHGVGGIAGTVPATRFAVGFVDPLFPSAARAAGATILTMLLGQRMTIRQRWIAASIQG